MAIEQQPMGGVQYTYEATTILLRRRHCGLGPGQDSDQVSAARGGGGGAQVQRAGARHMSAPHARARGHGGSK